MHWYNPGTYLFKGTTFEYNSALWNGGAIFIESNDVPPLPIKIRECIFKYNHGTSRTSGGAIYYLNEA